MYLSYWGLNKNPFDSVPDPGMYFSSHSTVESTVAELLFAIEEGNECLAVVVGEVGLGKTMTLRVVLNELDPLKYRIAYLTNPDVTFAQLMREVIGQLVGEPCQIRGKEDLLEAFNRLLFETADMGRKVLIFIDEGNALKGTCLEGLRLLTNMQEDTRNLMTIILAGQPKLARLLGDQRRANLFQRVGVYARLEPLDSPETVRQYIDHRLVMSGAQKQVFADSAIAAIFEHSKGIPRLINRVCKLCLKAGETNELPEIDRGLVEEIAGRFDAIRKPSASRRLFSAEVPESLTSEDPFDAESSVAKPALSVDTASIPENGEAPLPESRMPEAVSNKPAPQQETVEETSDLKAEPVNGHRMLPQLPTNVAESTSDDVSQEEFFVPSELIDALRNLPDERQRLKLAGQLAAKQIQEHPEHYTQATIDPVRAWDELRAFILRKLS